MRTQGLNLSGKVIQGGARMNEMSSLCWPEFARPGATSCEIFATDRIPALDFGTRTGWAARERKPASGMRFYRSLRILASGAFFRTLSPTRIS